VKLRHQPSKLVDLTRPTSRIVSSVAPAASREAVALGRTERRSVARRRRVSVVSFLVAAPAYAAGVALFVIAVVRFIGAAHPGTSQGDTRPLGDFSNGFAALVAGVVLLLLGAYAAKRPAPFSSLLTTACLAAGGAALLLFGAWRAHSGVLLAVGCAFAYPAIVALVRLAWLRRRVGQGQRT